MNTLLYYFAFPHYRKEIIKNLVSISSGGMEIAAGVLGRNDIKPLTSDDLETMVELETLKIGPFSWQKGIVSGASASRYSAVILGPAVMSLSTWAILIIRRIKGRRTYLWGQCGRKGEHSVKRVLQECMNRIATGLLVYGSNEAEAATDLGLNPRKVHIVHNATRSNREFTEPNSSEEAFERMQRNAQDAISEGAVSLIYIGRLIDSKKVDVLLDAAKQLRLRFHNLRVTVVGGGPRKELLEAKYSDTYVDFRGWIYDEDELNELIRQATFVVSPQHIGLLAVDGLRMGTPVLFPDNPRNGPEFESLTEGVNALRFVAGDSSSIVKAVDRWLAIAPSISEHQFTSARVDSLTRWAPESVAERILASISG